MASAALAFREQVPPFVVRAKQLWEDGLCSVLQTAMALHKASLPLGDGFSIFSGACVPHRLN